MKNDNLNATHLKEINSTNIDIYIEPSNDWHLEFSFDISKLNFSWWVEEYKEDLMTIQLNFTNPYEISP
jgi:hypothetical protein